MSIEKVTAGEIKGLAREMARVTCGMDLATEGGDQTVATRRTSGSRRCQAQHNGPCGKDATHWWAPQDEPSARVELCGECFQWAEWPLAMGRAGMLPRSAGSPGPCQHGCGPGCFRCGQGIEGWESNFVEGVVTRVDYDPRRGTQGVYTFWLNQLVGFTIGNIVACGFDTPAEYGCGTRPNIGARVRLLTAWTKSRRRDPVVVEIDVLRAGCGHRHETDAGRICGLPIRHDGDHRDLTPMASGAPSVSWPRSQLEAALLYEQKSATAAGLRRLDEELAARAGLMTFDATVTGVVSTHRRDRAPTWQVDLCDATHEHAPAAVQLPMKPETPEPVVGSRVSIVLDPTVPGLPEVRRFEALPPTAGREVVRNALGQLVALDGGAIKEGELIVMKIPPASPKDEALSAVAFPFFESFEGWKARNPTIVRCPKEARPFAVPDPVDAFRALLDACLVPAAIEGMKREWHSRNPHGRVTWDVRKGETLQVEFSLGGERAWTLFVLDHMTGDGVIKALDDAWRSIGASLARTWKPAVGR